MTAGVTIYNSSGYIQVTDIAPNFVLHQKGAVQLSGTAWMPGSGGGIGGTLQFGSHAAITVPNTLGYPPLIAFRCAREVALYRTRLEGGNWVFHMVSRLGQNATDWIEWWTFGPTPNAVPSNYGLEVRNSAGVLMYHSGYQPLRVADFQMQTWGSSGNFSIPEGRVLAIAPLSVQESWSQQLPAGTWQQMLFGTALCTNGTNGGYVVSLNYGQIFQTANFGLGAGSSGQWSAMAIDVTGY